MRLGSTRLFVAATGICTVIAALLAASPATRPAPPDKPPALSADITVRLDRSVMNPLAIATRDVENALGEFYRTHETFGLEQLQALEITGERGAKVPLSKIAKVEVRFERSVTTRPAVVK